MREMDQHRLERYVKDQGCEWRFNPPHASHFGGAWERQIGTIRRVLDAMFLELGGSQLTHELLVTLMAEVTAIVNARPITTIPSDTDEPEPLSPSMLLTMKTRPLGPPPGDFLPVDLYSRRCWRRVQYLADTSKQKQVEQFKAKSQCWRCCPSQGRRCPPKRLASRSDIRSHQERGWCRKEGSSAGM